VYDGNRISENPNIFASENNPLIKEYIYKGEGKWGNLQRNFAIDHIKNKDTFLYFLDDDNVIDPSLYNLLKFVDNHKMYTFNQKAGLKGSNVVTNHIDIAMCMIHYELCKEIRWLANNYNADGIFISTVYENNKNHHVFVDNELCYHNGLVL